MSSHPIPTPSPPVSKIPHRPRFNISPRIVPPPAPSPSRRILTRTQTGKLPPRQYLAAAPSGIPSTAVQALKLPHWRAALVTEFDALVRNHTWDLVPTPPDCNVLSNRWVFAEKTNPDGSLGREKARLVARGFEQIPGHDFGDTFSPVLKPATLRLLLGISVSNAWSLHQLDISNAFLHDTLKEEVYMRQPVGFIDPEHPDYVCRLRKSIYGLRQAPRAWFHCLSQALRDFGFVASQTDPSLFIYTSGSSLLYMLVYVDDLVITGNDSSVIQQLLVHFHSKFALRDLGRLSYFLGLEVHYTPTGLILNQRKYILELLERS
ncbi:unnamed protein product [Linum trigynum]|uniref:Reverse transcriptase Ty1/copia-type domain-containing protein n=1 Tax=Linum trigynum TaxID=586398 RepID=A0AAV2CZV1_9ROSI